MAVCSYCQRIKPFRPVKAVVVDASGIKSWTSSFDRYIATHPMRSRRSTSHMNTAYQGNADDLLDRRLGRGQVINTAWPSSVKTTTLTPEADAHGCQSPLSHKRKIPRLSPVQYMFSLSSDDESRRAPISCLRIAIHVLPMLWINLAHVHHLLLATTTPSSHRAWLHGKHGKWKKR